LILDSFIAFFEGNENQSSEVRGALKIITSWIEKYDLSVIVLHHLRKPDINHSKTNVYDVRGSGDFLAFADMLYMLEPSGEFIMLKQEINRDDAVNDAIKLRFVFDKEKKLITLTNEGEAPYQHSKDNKQDVCKDAIKEWFREINENEARYSAERKEIITIMLSKGFTKSTIERSLLELLFKDKFFKKKENREKYTLNYDKLQRTKDNFNEAS
jgi:RecA-family ATPase